MDSLCSPGGGEIIMHIWNRVYKNFQEVPAMGEAFRSKIWIENSLEKLRVARKNPLSRNDSATLLSLLTAIVFHRKGRATILDFGGGIGITYYEVARSLPAVQSLKYYIIENEKVCGAGKKAFAKDHRVSFLTKLPTNLSKTDVVHLGSSLQYIENWKDLLNLLAKLASPYLLLTDLPAGNIPSFATVQNYYGYKIPYWFFSLKEIVNFLKTLGFKLVFKSIFLDSNTNANKFLNSNFPKRYRLDNTCNLLFCHESH